MNNPAFDDARASGDGSSGVASDTATEAETGGGGSTTDASDTSDTSDTTDPSTTDTGTSETGTEEMCAFLERPALRMSITAPDGLTCPPTVDEQFLLLDSATFNQPLGMATGIMCGDVGCQQCTNLSRTVGAQGFAGLAEVWSVLGSLVEINGVDAVCVEVAATQLVGPFDGTCVYDTLAIVDNSIEHGPVFLGNGNNAPLTWVGDLVLGQLGAPSLGPEPLGSCACATVHPDRIELDCCESSGVEPQFHAIAFAGLEVAPGGSKKIPILQVPWQFHAVQAQTVADCDNPRGKTELSWALARVE